MIEWFIVLLLLLNLSVEDEVVECDIVSCEVEVEHEVEVEAIDYVEREVIFSNYYTHDGSSGDTTASGWQTKDFKVNSEGMYTYDDKVVVATANTTRLKRRLYEGYQSNELYDEFTINVNDKLYDAIVLDVCGACYGLSHEEIQRVDIFTTSDVIGLTRGKVRENND